MRTETVTFFLRGGARRTFRTASIEGYEKGMRNSTFLRISVKREDKQCTHRYVLEGDARTIEKYIKWAKS